MLRAGVPATWPPKFLFQLHILATHRFLVLHCNIESNLVGCMIPLNTHNTGIGSSTPQPFSNTKPDLGGFTSCVQLLCSRVLLVFMTVLIEAYSFSFLRLVKHVFWLSPDTDIHVIVVSLWRSLSSHIPNVFASITFITRLHFGKNVPAAISTFWSRTPAS